MMKLLSFISLFVAVLVDNFQLTLADAEIRRKKEELMFLEEQQKFDDEDNLENEIDGIFFTYILKYSYTFTCMN